MGCAIGALPRGCQGSSRAATLVPAVGGGSRTCAQSRRAGTAGGHGARGRDAAPGLRATGESVAPGRVPGGPGVALPGGLLAAEAEGPARPDLEVVRLNAVTLPARACWESQSLGFRSGLTGWCAPSGAQKLHPLWALRR